MSVENIDRPPDLPASLNKLLIQVSDWHASMHAIGHCHAHGLADLAGVSYASPARNKSCDLHSYVPGFDSQELDKRLLCSIGFPWRLVVRNRVDAVPVGAAGL